MIRSQNTFARMKSLIFLSLFGITLASNIRVRRGTQCGNSFDCTSGTRPCCRDAKGRAIVQQEGRFEIFGPHPRTGTCSNVLSSEGDECNHSCGCQTGYTCYRPMSGVCCPLWRCYDETWVERQRRYWANCRPPNCYFPA